MFLKHVGKNNKHLVDYKEVNMSLGEKDQIIKTFCNVCKIGINHKICYCINSSGKSSAGKDTSMDGTVQEYLRICRTV